LKATECLKYLKETGSKGPEFAAPVYMYKEVVDKNKQAPKHQIRITKGNMGVVIFLIVR
jgi:hypothetical protein